jgi:transposase
LQQLCHFANAPPGPVKWKNFYSHFVLLLMLQESAKNEAGMLARSLAAEMDSLWTFLDEHGVEPTNNRAERALRFGVLWRKRRLGSQSDKGLRWVERILSWKRSFSSIKRLLSWPAEISMPNSPNCSSKIGWVTWQW